MHRQLAIVMLLLLLGSPRQASGACECERQLRDGEPRAELTAEEIESYVAIFRGKATGFTLEDSSRTDGPQPFEQDVLITFDVLDGWKGVTGPTHEVRTPLGTWACGFTFRMDEEYLVFLTKPTEEFPHDVGMCSRTRTARYATVEIKKLDEVLGTP